MLQSAGKMLIVAGIAMSAVGSLILLLDKAGYIGRIPGDIVVRHKNFTFNFSFDDFNSCHRGFIPSFLSFPEITYCL